VLAHLADRGVRVTLACATAGEAGKVHPSLGTVADLGAIRVEELKVSCKVLGVDPPIFLGFHDSGRKERFRRDDPRALANADMLDVEAAIRRVIADVKPHVILTFDPHGAYYHPDHLAIQRATTAAFFSSGTLGGEAPERLFYATMLPDVFRGLAAATRGRGIVDDLDPDLFATAPEMIAVSFDASAYLERKLLAFAAHQSAFGLTPETLKNPPAGPAEFLQAIIPVMKREVFVLGGVRGPVPRWPLSNFFDGLQVPAGATPDSRA
jgi:LmbE family N-acetylglucosaminyl deacetylase